MIASAGILRLRKMKSLAAPHATRLTLLLTWAIVRLIHDRLQPKPRAPDSKHINAWEEAGRRYELDESDTQPPPDE